LFGRRDLKNSSLGMALADFEHCCVLIWASGGGTNVSIVLLSFVRFLKSLLMRGGCWGFGLTSGEVLVVRLWLVRDWLSLGRGWQWAGLGGVHIQNVSSLYSLVWDIVMPSTILEYLILVLLSREWSRFLVSKEPLPGGIELGGHIRTPFFGAPVQFLPWLP
jgi:hypothetical protein